MLWLGMIVISMNDYNDDNLYSPAGADGKKCQKKVTQEPTGEWICESCQQ